MSQVPLDFSAYITDRTRDFVGREWVFDAIDAWLADPDASRFLTITGEPGIGKTAIAARLTQVRTVHAFHFCMAREGRTIDPMLFVRSLSQQLVDRLPDFGRFLVEQEAVHIHLNLQINKLQGGTVQGVHIGHLSARSAAEAFRALIRDPLVAWLANGSYRDTILLLVDGLDEAVHFGHSPTIVDLIVAAQDLPRQVRWLLTSRPGEHVALVPGSSLVLEDRSAENMADVRSYALRRLRDLSQARPPQPAPVDHNTLADRMALRSEGNFLYLRHILGNLGQEVTPAHLSQELDRLPSGLTGIYREFMDRVLKHKARVEWRHVHGPVLGVLAAAQEPLTLDQLARLSGVVPQDVSTVINDFEQLLYLDKASKPHRYSLYHSSFGSFLIDRECNSSYWIDPQQSHHQIAEYYLHPSTWRTHGGYALRNLSTHLQQAGLNRHLVSLVMSRDWRAAHVEYSMALTAFLRDVEVALDVLEEQERSGIPHLVAASLLHSSVLSRAAEVPLEVLKAMVWLGRKEEASNYASLIRDDGQRAIAQAVISAQLASAGSAAQARRELQRALSSAERIEREKDLEEAMRIISRTVPFAAGPTESKELLSRAAAIAVTRGREEVKIACLSTIALALIQSGLDRQAGEVLFHALQRAETMIQDGCAASNQALSLGQLSEAFARANDFAGLTSLLRLLEKDPYDLRRVPGICAVAQSVASRASDPLLSTMRPLLRDSLERTLRAYTSDARRSPVGDELQIEHLCALAQALDSIGEQSLSRLAFNAASDELKQARPEKKRWKDRVEATLAEFLYVRLGNPLVSLLHLNIKSVAVTAASVMGPRRALLELDKLVYDSGRQKAFILYEVATTLADAGNDRQARAVIEHALHVTENVRSVPFPIPVVVKKLRAQSMKTKLRAQAGASMLHIARKSENPRLILRALDLCPQLQGNDHLLGQLLVDVAGTAVHLADTTALPHALDAVEFIDLEAVQCQAMGALAWAAAVSGKNALGNQLLNTVLVQLEHPLPSRAGSNALDGLERTFSRPWLLGLDWRLGSLLYRRRMNKIWEPGYLEKKLSQLSDADCLKEVVEGMRTARDLVKSSNDRSAARLELLQVLASFRACVSSSEDFSFVAHELAWFMGEVKCDEGLVHLVHMARKYCRTYDLAPMFLAIAWGMAVSGNARGFTHFFKETPLHPAPDQALAISWVAQVMATTSARVEFFEALVAVQRLETRDERRRALRGVVRALVQAGAVTEEDLVQFVHEVMARARRVGREETLCCIEQLVPVFIKLGVDRSTLNCIEEVLKPHEVC